MKIASCALRTFKGVSSRQFHQTHVSRSLVTSSDQVNGDYWNKKNGSMESEEERRMFGELPGSNSKTDAYFESTEKWSKFSEGSASNGNRRNFYGDSSYSMLSDGKDGKLKSAATYFQFDPEEIMNDDDDYKFRPDINFSAGTTYETKDLDLTKPGVRRSKKRNEFEVTTEEVLRKADFRNVKFLAKFITEAGIINKRNKTGISAKAQRKIAREIKTARAFGLMPFTTMGKKSFVFGNTAEPLDSDYAYESYDVGDVAEDKDAIEV